MSSSGKNQNITSFNDYSKRAHIVSDLHKNSGYGYYDGTSALDYSEDYEDYNENGEENDNITDINDYRNDLDNQDNSSENSAYEDSNYDGNSNENNNNSDALKSGANEGLKLFAKKKIPLKFKLIICAAGAGVMLLFIIIVTLSTSNNGANLDLVNNSNSAQMSSGSSSSSGGSVEAGTNGNNLLNVSLVSAIGTDNYNKLNEEILSIAKSSCNKETVAEVASALVKGVGEYGYRIPYYWGGGHSGTTYMGVDGNLGAQTGQSCSDTNCYYHAGYDCSGFVSWAVGNVLGRNFSMTTYGFLDISTPISWAEAGAGDILVSTGHIVLILQNNGDYFTTVESAGGNQGLIFSTYDQAKISSYGMQIKSMSNYFASNC